MNINGIITICVFMACSINAMQQQNAVQYRQADLSDLGQLLNILNSTAVQDRDKIVVLPERFREMALTSSLEKKRMFVAEDNGVIVGYKKLFMLTDDAEKDGILREELRCVDNSSECTFTGKVMPDGSCIEDKEQLPAHCFDTVIYNGGDFTLPAVRGRGINQSLTTMALLSLAPSIEARQTDKDAKNISMVYGITQANAGAYPGAQADRTPSISKSFACLIRALQRSDDPVIFQHQRYNAFMPTFDPASTALKPLPDEQSIPGYGCVLACCYRPKNNKGAL